jgi:DNA (cytosine-5)-methyltransferase 1
MKSNAFPHHFSEKLNLVSLFAGAGGIDIGFEASGLFRTVIAADWADYAFKTLETNKKMCHRIGLASLAPWLALSNSEDNIPNESVILEDAEILRLDLSEGAGPVLKSLYSGPVDVVVGGPPCQAFSVRNRRADKGLMDEKGRGNLIFSFMELVKDLKAKAFVFENVMGLERTEYGNLVEKIVTFARDDLGYRVTIIKVVASEFGLPQDRKRIIIVGTEKNIDFSPPAPTHGTKDLFDSNIRLPFVTVREALRGLPEPGTLGAPANHKAPNHSDQMRARFAQILPGKQDPIRKKIRLHPDRPCPTLFSGSDTGGGLADIHPWENRALTPRECARLQGFPDFWELCSNRSGEVYKLVANAVPPPLAASIAIQLGRAIKISRKERTK